MSVHREPPRRSSPFGHEPGFYPDAGLWLYGNVRLLDANLVYVPQALGQTDGSPETCTCVEHETERIVLEGRIVVTGIHNPAHRKVAVVALRWGAPRILVLSGGFFFHLGKDLKDEPFPEGRLWRHSFDPKTDLVVSRRAPDRRPTHALHNTTVDRLVVRIAERQVPGLLFKGL